MHHAQAINMPGRSTLRIAVLILLSQAGLLSPYSLHAALLQPPDPEKAKPVYNPNTIYGAATQDPELDRQRALTQIFNRTRALQEKEAYTEALEFLFGLPPRFSELPEVMVLKARLSFLSGASERGLEIINSAIAAHPEHIEVLRTRTDLLQAAGKLEQALKSGRQLLPYIPYDEAVIRQVADLSLVLEGPEKALGYYRDLAAQQPDQAEALSIYGQVLFKMHRLEMAREAQRKVLDMDPRSADACVNLGATLFKLDRHEEATALFIRAAQLQPDHPEALYNLTVAALAEGQNEEALRLLNVHLQQHPTQQRAWRAFWVALSRRLASLPDSGIEQPPEADAAWHHQQMIRFFKENDWLRAVRHVLQAFILDPENSTYLNNLAALLHEDMPGASSMVFKLMALQDSDNTAARQNLDQLNRIWRLAQLERAVEAEPDNAEAQWTLATSMADSGDIQKAVLHFRRASELEPENMDYVIGLSKALSFLGQHQDAASTYRTVLSRSKDEAAHLNRMAWLLLRIPDAQSAELEEARALAGKAVKRESENPDYTATWAEALHRQGKVRRARSAAEKALALARERNSPVLLKWIQERLSGILE